MKIKIDKKVLDKQVSVWVNSKDWLKFTKNSKELMGLNPSQSISFLAKCFNRKGDFTDLSKIIVEALKPVVERELTKEMNKVAKRNSK